MSDEINGRYALTEPVVMTFPQLFEAKAVGKKGQATGKLKFSANFLLARSSVDERAMKERAIQIAKARWPGRDIKELKFPFSNGDKTADKRVALGKKDGEFNRGHSILVARSGVDYPPRLSLLENGKFIDLDGPARAAAKPKFYPGVKVLCEVILAPYEGVGTNPDGVCAYLNAVVSLNEGERLAGGARSAAETFKGYVGHTTTEDPTDDLSDLE